MMLQSLPNSGSFVLGANLLPTVRLSIVLMRHYVWLNIFVSANNGSAIYNANGRCVRRVPIVLSLRKRNGRKLGRTGPFVLRSINNVALTDPLR